MLDSPLDIALTRFPISTLWNLLGLPGIARKSCRSPFRYEEDTHPSFSVFDDDRRWKDHASGEGGDAAAFLAKHLGISNEEACKQLIKMAGVLPAPKVVARTTTARSYDAEAEEKAQKRNRWPAFEIPTTTEIKIIAAGRDLSEEGVAIAVERGLLFSADSQEGRAWILSDSRRQCAQARRLDGQPWQRINGRKAWTLPGSVANWPIGLSEAKAFPAIALVEGGPDLLAAYHLAWCVTSTPETLALGKGADVLGNLGVVAIFGARTHIVDAALPLFADKRVRIFAHDDASGYGGAALWTSQLKAAGAAVVDTFGFAGFRQSDGRNLNDLNDFVRLDYDQWEAERELVESIFDFVPATQRLQPNTYA